MICRDLVCRYFTCQILHFDSDPKNLISLFIKLKKLLSRIGIQCVLQGMKAFVNSFDKNVNTHVALPSAIMTFRKCLLTEYC